MIVAALTALAYLALGLGILLRRDRPSAIHGWMAAYCGWSAVVAGAFGLEAAGLAIVGLAPGIWLAISSLVGMSLLGALTFSYTRMGRAWIWLLAMLPLALLVLLADFADPSPGLSEMAWRAALAAPSALAPLGAAGLWCLLALGLVAAALRSASTVNLPLHANRLLWWLLTLPLITLGEAGAMWGAETMSFPGQALRLVGVVGAVYSVTTTDLIDIRSLFRAWLGNALFVVVTAMVTLVGILASLYLLQRLPGSRGYIVVGGVALVAALIYQAIRSLMGQLVREAVLKAGYDTAQVSADYSKRVAEILDIDELAGAAGQALAQSVEATKSAILLLTPESDKNLVRAEVFVGSGQMPRMAHKLPAASAYLGHLTQARQPLPQYAIDVHAQFKALAMSERRWLQRLGVDVHVPIRDGLALSAVLAVGPRKSRDPYRRRELELLSAIADQTSVALKNARLVTNLRAMNMEMRALNESLGASNERLRELDRVKSDFITIASHELRTPLTQILGFSDLLNVMSGMATVAGPEIAPITESVITACHRLHEVINQMQDVSQIDVETMQLKLVETTVEAVLRAAVEPYAAAILERKQAFAVQGIRNLPPIQGDARRLGQALRHVVGNAIKFTPDGGLIEVRGRHLPREDGQPESVEIVVADSGVGISPKYLSLIFEKFFRVGSTDLHSTGATKFMGAGPGLGLPLAKGIIEAHGGRIWAESPGFDMDKNPGTQVYIVLPLRPPPFTSKGTPAFVGMEDAPAPVP